MSPCSTPATMSKYSVSPSGDRTFHIYIYIYIYRERERERGRVRVAYWLTYSYCGIIFNSRTGRVSER